MAKTAYDTILERGTLIISSIIGGTTADEVALFQAEDADGAAELLSTAQQRIADRAESYADYMPDEAAKLDKAIAEQHGTYVVVCVCSQPEEAQSILDEAFGS